MKRKRDKGKEKDEGPSKSFRTKTGGHKKLTAQSMVSAGPRGFSLLNNKTDPIKFRYYESITLNGGMGGTADTHVFSANGMYDPNISSTGHQPRGFDQLMALYDHYVCIGSSIRADVLPNTTFMGYGISLEDDQLAYSDPTDYIEGRNLQDLKYLGKDEAVGPKSLTGKFSTKKFFGRGEVLSDDLLKGTAGANPAEQAFYNVFAWDANAGDPPSVRVHIIIEYICILTEPKTPAQS